MILAWLCLSTAQATEGRRIALVVGNGNYQQATLPKLRNPANDAADMANALRRFGFEVIEKQNLTLKAMNEAIASFGSRLGGSDAALFYFAGHGIQVKSQNYLIPVDAEIDSEASVPYQGVNLNQILDEMDNGKSNANIVILDACRNNPLTGKFRSGKIQGLASPGTMPRGTVIVFATEPGNVAADGGGRNGLLTAGLLRALGGNDLSLDEVLTIASDEVEKASGQKQTPYINGPKTLQKNFHFTLTINPGTREIERTFWESIEHSADAADFEAYLRKYPNGSYVTLAENRLRHLRTGRGELRKDAESPMEKANTPAAGASTAFDGHWAVSLVCDDVQVNGKSARGYTFNFFSEIKDGKVSGQYGVVGRPASLTLVGTVQPDGVLDLNAFGLSGNPEMTLNRAQPSTPYSYRMHGNLNANGGKAKRLEQRTCEATFFRN